MVRGGQNETTSLILVNFVLLPFSPLSTAQHTLKLDYIMVGRAVPNGSPWIYCVGKCSAEWPTSHTQPQRYGIKCHVIKQKTEMPSESFWFENGSLAFWFLSLFLVLFSFNRKHTSTLKHAHSRLMVGRAVPNGSHLDVLLVSAVPNGQLLTLKLKGMY